MNKLNKLYFGTAGIPISAKLGGTIGGIKQVRKLKLEAMELEFVRSINISEEKAPEVKKTAEENDIVLTCHAPYFINLNSQDKKIYHASIHRIVKSAEITSLCGGYSVCFHAGYYQGISHDEVYKRVKNALQEIINKVSEVNKKVWIRPEVSGKFSQFGTLQEVLNLSEELDQVLPCIDFAHHHAKGGKNNSYADFCKILEGVEKQLGSKALGEMHIHVSGIEYGEKGEKHHLTLEKSDLKYKELMKALKDFSVKGVLISESPNIEVDALLMKREYER